MKSLLPLISLIALVAGRRHLCADLQLPICHPSGPPTKAYPAVYRIVWRNQGDGYQHGCHPGDGPPLCADGSTPQRVFNVCKNDQKMCPNGYGRPGSHQNSQPFDACPDGRQPLCPSGKAWTCAFRHKRCHPYTSSAPLPRKQCNKGRPHCPWFTRNRNDEWKIPPTTYNHGSNRPQNKLNGHWINGGQPGATWVEGGGIQHQPEYRRPCAGACPCDNWHLFDATEISVGAITTVGSWQECGTLCKTYYGAGCRFWEWHKAGAHRDRCKLVSNYRTGVKRTNDDYKVVSGSFDCTS